MATDDPRPNAVIPTGRRSLAAFNAVRFFLGAAMGIVAPVLSNLLWSWGWSYRAIGLVLSSSTLALSAVQTPAGILADRFGHHRQVLMLAVMVVGLCYAGLPLIPHSAWFVVPVLIISGIGQGFFYPFEGALAMSLSGPSHFARTIGTNLAWNQLGNLTSALIAIGLASIGGISLLFYAVGVNCLLAGLAALLIQQRDLRRVRLSHHRHGAQLGELIREPRMLVLGSTAFIYSFVNSPMLAFAGLYVKHLHGSLQQVAALVLVAQVAMIPSSLAAAALCRRWGLKTVLGIAFVIQPIRIILYAASSQPWEVIAIEFLDGLAAGLYGVALVVLAARLTEETRFFNTINSALATISSVGGMIGMAAAGEFVHTLGFGKMYGIMAAIAAVGAAMCWFLLPPPKSMSSHPSQGADSSSS